MYWQEWDIQYHILTRVGFFAAASSSLKELLSFRVCRRAVAIFFVNQKVFVFGCMTAASRMVDHFLSKTSEVAQTSKPAPKPPLNTSKSALHSVTHTRFLLSLSLSLQCPFPHPPDLTQTHTVFF